MKKTLSVALASVMLIGAFTGCKATESDMSGSEQKVLKVAALESAYGTQIWKDIAKAFEEDNEGVKVELTVDKNLEDVISPKMKAGDYPDVVHLSIGREKALTETMTKENGLRDLSNMLDMTVPGEDVKVKDKIIPEFLGTSITNPYSDGKPYLAPAFYGPCGLFYNAGLFEQKNWKVPTTWDEMWELAETAKAEGIALFTYPTAGYFDALFYALLMEAGGSEFFEKATHYSEGIWDTAEAGQVFEIIGKLAANTETSTVANANNDNYLKNQQLILDNKALFMPNGTWVTGEMVDAPRADGFEWGFMALPAIGDGDRYSYTYFEQTWSPKKAANPELADKFMAFLYSDKAAEIFATAGKAEDKGPAVQPIKNASSLLEGENKLFYSIYDNDAAKAVMGAFATTDPVEGVSIADAVFNSINSVVSGDKTLEQWKAGIVDASNKLRGALK